MKAKSVAKIAGWVVLGTVGAAALAFLLGLAVQALWNWLMPSIFGLPAVTYWQALGLFILSHLLFKSHMGGHGDHKGPHANHVQPGFVRRRVLDMLREGNEAKGAGEPGDGAR